MHAWEAIQKAVDYIKVNLSQKLTPEKLAEIASLSPFYFQRLFTRLVKRPVNEYIKMRRLARACEALSNTNIRILDIALENGFNSHETFTKNFKGAFGITPEMFRENPVPLNQVIKPELLLNYTMLDENVPLITDDIVIEIKRETINNSEAYIGLKGQVPIAGQIPVGEATGIDVPHQIWDRFHKLKSEAAESLADEIELGVSMMGENEDTFTYFAGALAHPGIIAPKEFEIWEMPAADYVVCSFEAESPEELRTIALDKAMKYLFGTWLTNHKLITQPFSVEKYYKSDSNYMEIWVLPMQS